MVVGVRGENGHERTIRIAVGLRVLVTQSRANLTTKSVKEHCWAQKRRRP